MYEEFSIYYNIICLIQLKKLEHLESTILSLVGLQVWRGALLLADFILFHGKTYFNDKDFLELGSGVGLTSVIAGIYAKSVVCSGRLFNEVCKSYRE